jgi:hypothetical protein
MIEFFSYIRVPKTGNFFLNFVSPDLQFVINYTVLTFHYFNLLN